MFPPLDLLVLILLGSISRPTQALPFILLSPQSCHMTSSLLDRNCIDRDTLAELPIREPPRNPSLITDLSPALILLVTQASAELRDWIIEWMISIATLDRLKTFELVV